MKRLFTFFLLVLSIFTVSKIVEASSTTVEVQVLQGTGLSAGTGSSFSAEVGSTVSMDTSSFRPTGSTFQFWIVDGSLRHYPEDHTFRIQSSMSLIAVYAKADEHVVIFIDSNGKIIKAGENLAQYLAENAVVTVPTAPTKPKSSFLGWSLLGSTAAPTLTIPNASGHAVYLATYEGSTEVVSHLTVVNGTITGETEAEEIYNINDVASVTANAGNFSYWVDENNQILSKQQTYKFAMLNKDRTVTAVFDDEKAISTPIINLVDYPDLRGGEYVSYVGQYELVEGYELVEFGIVYEKEGADVYAKATNYNHETNEFLMSFLSAGKSNFRAYLKYVDASGFVFTEYNADMTDAMASDLIISEYIEGSSNNKFIELYNGTGESITLDNVYKVELYSNGAATASNTLNLTGTMADGEVLIIKNSNASADFYTGTATVVANAVANFNGDDAIVLKKNNVVIDSFGKVGTDPGTAWSGGGVTTIDKTLVRKSTVLSGRTDSTSAFNPSLEWIQHDIDTNTFLGSHTMHRGSSVKYDQKKVNIASQSLPEFGTYSTPQTLELPKYNENGALITWAFQDETDPNNSYINLETGAMTLPDVGTKTVKIKATIQVGTTSVEKLYEFSVLGKLTIEEVRQKENGTDVEFLGVVSGFTDYSEQYSNFDKVFIEDSTAAIVVYQAVFPQDLKVGDRYKVTGKLDSYSGLIQIARGATVEKLESDIELIAPIEVIDLTEIDESYQGKRVDLEGTVVSVLSTGQSLVVKVGENQITVRSNSNSADHTVNSHLLTATVGQVVKLHGIHVDWYNGAQLLPTTVEQIEFLEISDVMKVADAKEALELPAVATIEGLTLPEAGLHGTVITWASSNEAIIAIDGTVVLPTKETEVTLTATITVGEVTDTKEFSVTVFPEGSTEPVLSSVTVLFGTTNTKSTSDLTLSSFKTAYGSKFSPLSVTSIDVTKAYGSANDSIKFGNSKVGGSLKMTFDNSSIVKVVVIARAYGASEAAKLKVNDILADSNLSMTSAEYTFEFGATNSITIEGSKTTKNRFYLDSIIIYYSNPA